MTDIRFLGQSCFELSDGNARVVVDPFLAPHNPVATVSAGDLDATAITSNTFMTEWPPRSGRTEEFPEVDRAEWFGLDAAREKINPAQAALLDRLT